MELNGYEHKVQYYETDQMGCVHHSNYIRWFEEARTAYLEQLDMGYARRLPVCSGVWARAVTASWTGKGRLYP